jgi:hypothetical protein
MIEENFLQRAVNIRRTYLKLINNMDFYKDKAKSVINRLDDTIGKIEVIKGQVNDNKIKKDNSINTEYVMSELLKIIQDVEDEGIKLENLVDPLNKEIEKLALEEQELYRLIKEKHNNLSDDQIVESVRNRLIKENLS